MRRIYYLTGSTGWVGGEVLKLLMKNNEEVVVFIRQKNELIKQYEDKIKIVYGDVTDKQKCLEFLTTSNNKNVEQVVIHCAANISVDDKFDLNVFNTNYYGTKNLADISLSNKVHRFIYVSSTTAFKAENETKIINENSPLEDDPNQGDYAISKSMATSYVKKLTKQGLNSIIIYPSGIIGPDDPKQSSLTMCVNSVLRGKIPVSVKGVSYNLVDVRDVGDAIYTSIEKGKVGEGYIITNSSMPIDTFLNQILEKENRKKIKVKLHAKFVRFVSPIYVLFCRLFKKTPLYTKTAMNTIIYGNTFDNKKAVNELGVTLRDLNTSINEMSDDVILKDKRCKKGRRPITPRGRLFTLLGGLTTFGILFSIRYIPGVAEGYTRTFGKFFAFLFGHIFTWIPFSIFEISVILIAISVVLWIVFFIIHTAKKGIKKSYTRIIDLGIVLSSCLVSYAMTFSFAYHRDRVPIPQYEEIFDDKSIYKEVAMYYEADFNSVSNQLNYREDGSVINPYTWPELNEIVKSDFAILTDDYFYDFTLNAKPMYMLSWLYSELQITGVSFPVTGEPNYNIAAPAAGIPFTMAHEIAHTKGALREEDANLVAAYICLNSKDPFVKYSGYMATFFSLSNLVRATNVESDYTEYINGINPNIWKDISYNNKYWDEHDLLGAIGDFFNNLYLRISANEGTDAYIDHDDIEKTDEGGQIIYRIYSYSPYQSLYLYQYFNK